MSFRTSLDGSGKQSFKRLPFERVPIEGGESSSLWGGRWRSDRSWSRSGRRWQGILVCLPDGGCHEYCLEGMDCFWTECLLYSKRWNIFRAEHLPLCGSEESLFLIHPGWHPCRGLEPCTHPRGVGSPLNIRSALLRSRCNSWCLSHTFLLLE